MATELHHLPELLMSCGANDSSTARLKGLQQNSSSLQVQQPGCLWQEAASSLGVTAGRDSHHEPLLVTGARAFPGMNA